MKRLTTLALLGLASILLVTAAQAATVAPPPSAVKPAAPAAAAPKHTDAGRAYFKEQAFSFVAPEGWVKADPPTGCFMLYTIPPALDEFMPNMNTNVNPAGNETPDQILPQIKKALGSILANYKPVDEGKTTINGCAAFYISATFGAADTPLQNLQYGILDGHGKIYVVTFTGPASAFATLRPVFEKVAMTILVGGPAPAVGATGGSPASEKSATPAVKAGAPKHADAGRAYDKVAGFSFVPAEGWVKSNVPQGCFLAYAAPEATEGLLRNMNAIVQADGPPDASVLPSILLAIKKSMATELEGYKAVDEGKVTINGRPAAYISGTFVMLGKNIQNLQYIILGANKKLYIVTFAGGSTDFATARPLFEKMAMSILTD